MIMRLLRLFLSHRCPASSDVYDYFYSSSATASWLPTSSGKVRQLGCLLSAWNVFHPLAILDRWMTYATVWQANISLCLMPSIPHWLDSNSFLKICTVAGCLIICRLQFRRLINLDTIQFSLIPSNELWASAQRKLSNSIDPINFCLIKPIALRTDELRWCRPAQQLFPSKH